MLLPYLTDSLGIAALWAGVIVFVPKAWDVVLNPIAGRISDRTINQFQMAKLARLGGLALGMTALALVLAAVSPWLPASIFFVVLVGVSSSGFLACHLPITALVSPARLRSLGFALFGFWFGIGAIIMSGFVAGIGENQGYRWGISVLAVIVAIAGAIYASAHGTVEADIQDAVNSLHA